MQWSHGIDVSTSARSQRANTALAGMHTIGSGAAGLQDLAMTTPAGSSVGIVGQRSAGTLAALGAGVGGGSSAAGASSSPSLLPVHASMYITDDGSFPSNGHSHTHPVGDHHRQQHTHSPPNVRTHVRRARSHSLGIESVETVSASGLELSSSSLSTTASSRVRTMPSMLGHALPSDFSMAAAQTMPKGAAFMQAQEADANAHARFQQNLHNLANGGKSVSGHRPVTMTWSHASLDASTTNGSAATSSSTADAAFRRSFERLVAELDADRSLAREQKAAVLDAFVVRHRQRQREQQSAVQSLKVDRQRQREQAIREEFARRERVGAMDSVMQRFHGIDASSPRTAAHAQAVAQEARAARARAESEATSRALAAEAEARALHAQKVEQLRKLEQAMLLQRRTNGGATDLSPEQMEQLRRALQDPMSAGGTVGGAGHSTTNAQQRPVQRDDGIPQRGILSRSASHAGYLNPHRLGSGVSPLLGQEGASHGGGMNAGVTFPMQHSASYGAVNSANLSSTGAYGRPFGLTPIGMKPDGAFISSRVQQSHSFSSTDNSQSNTLTSPALPSTYGPTNTSLSSGLLASLQGTQQERFEQFLKHKSPGAPHTHLPQTSRRPDHHGPMSAAERREAIMREQSALRMADIPHQKGENRPLLVQLGSTAPRGSVQNAKNTLEPDTKRRRVFEAHAGMNSAQDSRVHVSTTKSSLDGVMSAAHNGSDAAFAFDFSGAAPQIGLLPHASADLRGGGARSEAAPTRTTATTEKKAALAGQKRGRHTMSAANGDTNHDEATVKSMKTEMISENSTLALFDRQALVAPAVVSVPSASPLLLASPMSPTASPRQAPLSLSPSASPRPMSAPSPFDFESFPSKSSQDLDWKPFPSNSPPPTLSSSQATSSSSASSSSTAMPVTEIDANMVIDIDTSRMYDLSSDVSVSSTSSMSSSRSSSCLSSRRGSFDTEEDEKDTASTTTPVRTPSSSSASPSTQSWALIPHNSSPRATGAVPASKRRVRYRKRVCQHCFEAKAACDAQRPCGRCVRLHKPLCQDRRPEKRAPQKRGGVPLLPTSYLSLFGIDPSTLEHFDITKLPTVEDWAAQHRAVKRATALTFSKLRSHLTGQRSARVLRFIQSSVDYVGFTTKADRVAFQEELQSIVGLERHKMPKCRVKFVKGQSLFSNTTDFLPRLIQREMDTHCGIARTLLVGRDEDGDWNETTRTFEYNKRLQQMFGFTKAEMTRHFAKNRLRYAHHMNAEDWHTVLLKGIQFYQKMRKYRDGYRMATVYRLVRKDGSTMPVIELRTKEIKGNVGCATLILIPLAL